MKTLVRNYHYQRWKQQRENLQHAQPAGAFQTHLCTESLSGSEILSGH